MRQTELRPNGVLRSPDARSCIASVQRALRHVFVWPRLDRPDAAAHPRAWKGSPLRKCVEGLAAKKVPGRDRCVKKGYCSAPRGRLCVGLVLSAGPPNKHLRFSEAGAPRSGAGRRACGRGRAGEGPSARRCHGGRGVRGGSGGLVGRGPASRARRALARPR
jgi:hypothetical protein